MSVCKCHRAVSHHCSLPLTAIEHLGDIGTDPEHCFGSSQPKGIQPAGNPTTVHQHQKFQSGGGGGVFDVGGRGGVRHTIKMSIEVQYRPTLIVLGKLANNR